MELFRSLEVGLDKRMKSVDNDDYYIGQRIRNSSVVDGILTFRLFNDDLQTNKLRPMQVSQVGAVLFHFAFKVK
jgi:hypothetical protein